jgi:hypothetical protein
MDRFEQEVVTELSKEKPCKTKNRYVCDRLYTSGMSCSIRKTSGRNNCVSNSGKKAFNEDRFDQMKFKVIYNILLKSQAQENIVDFRDIVQTALKLVKSIDNEKNAKLRRDFVLAIYKFYITNVDHWNHSVKVATSLIRDCEKNLPVSWFEFGPKKEERKTVCATIKRLAQAVVDDKTTACLTNHDENFDFDNACFTDPITQECLQKRVVVNRNRKTEKGYMTECYNTGTASKLEVDPYNREAFEPHTIDRPFLVDPVKSCKRSMSKDACESFCRDNKYVEQKLARCLIPNKHWSKQMTTFEKVSELLRFKN